MYLWELLWLRGGEKALRTKDLAFIIDAESFEIDAAGVRKNDETLA